MDVVSKEEMDVREKMDAEMKRWLGELKQLQEPRGDDYGLMNFVHTAQIVSVLIGKDLTASDVVAVLFANKLARYMFKGKKDTVQDAAVYFLLYNREKAIEEALSDGEQGDGHVDVSEARD